MKNYYKPRSFYQLFRLLALIVLGFTSLTVNLYAQTLAVSELGVGSGWYSDDTRNTSGVVLNGTVNSFQAYFNYPGAPVATAANDAAIASQLYFTKTGTVSGGGTGVMAMDGTTSNSGKTSVRYYGNGTGIGTLNSSFSSSFRWYMDPYTTSRTVALNLMVLGTNNLVYSFSWLGTGASVNSWHTFSVNASTAPVSDNGWRLYNNGAPGSAAGAAKSLNDWFADPTYGAILNGATVLGQGFNIGSFQRQCRVGIDWLESSLINGGNRVDFVAPPALFYVNDNSTTGDVYTSAVGAAGNPGTAAAPFATIADAIAAAADGDIIYVDAGTYTENINVNKRLTIDGAGSTSTIVTAATGSVPTITVSGSGSSSADRLVIRDMKVTGATGLINLGSGILVSSVSAQSNITFENLDASFNGGAGIAFNATPAISDVKILKSNLSNNANAGIRIATAVASFNGLLVDSCTINNNASIAFSYNPDGNVSNTGTNFTISNTTFNNNSTAGVTNAHDISLFAFRGNATLSNVTVISGNGTTQNSNSYGISIDGGSGNGPLGTVSFNNVTVQGHVGKGALLFQRYTEISGVSMNNVDVSNCVAPWGQFILSHTDADAFAVGNTTLKSLVLWTTGGADATSAVFKHATSNIVLDRNVLADCFQMEDQMAHKTDVSTLGFARLKAGNVYVTTTSGSVQRGIVAATAGDMINVSAGTFSEQVSVSKAITLRGANTGTALTACGQTRAAETVINGTTGAAITIASNGVTVDGFELQGAIGLTSTAYTDLVVTNNKVNTLAQGISVAGATTSSTDDVTITGNAVTLSVQAISTTPTTGIVLASVGGTAAATVSNNLICGGFYGYALSNMTTTPRTVISGGSITGVMQGVAAFNSMLVAPFTPLPMTVGVDGITMSGFTGNVTAIPNANFHAGVYAYTAGSNAAAVLDITVNNVDISGTGKPNQASGGLYFADFSTVSSTLMNAAVTNSHIHGNLNRGVNVRGANAVATVSNSDILNNGADPFGTGGNDGYGVIASSAAQLTVNNCNIVNPATQVGFTVFAIGTGPAPVSTFTMSNSSILRNGNGAHMSIGGGGTLNATCNWWGVTSAQDVAAVAAAAASYINWLVSGTDTDLATRGFQPASGTCTGIPVSAAITSSTNPSCSNASDGAVDLTITGGVAPFTTNWNSGAYSTEDLSNVGVGVYSVLVTDANGSTATASVTLTAATAVTYYQDSDGDGFGSNTVSQTVCVQPSGYILASGDCDDSNAAVNPNAVEICNSIDDDCDGLVDTADPSLVALATPGSISAAGGLVVCKPYAAGSTTISVPAVTLATGYFWSVPSGLTIVSGQGTTSIVVSWTTQSIDPVIRGNVSVTASNACGTSAASNAYLEFATVAPVTPNSISGSARVCPGDVATYSVAAVARATSYNWTLPAGMTITSGAGSNVITVSVAAGYVGGNITVSAVNACGNSPLRTRSTALNMPATPGVIAGPANGICQASGVVYTIASVPTASSYSWSVPAGATIVSGQGSNTITVDFGLSFSSGAITVSSVNNCGTSSARSISVTGIPARPGTISGLVSPACGGQSYTYGVATVSGASSYVWTVTPGGSVTFPSPMILNGKDAQITWAAGAPASQGVTVRAANTCGSSTTRSAGVTVNSCPRLSAAEVQQWNMYPNPATDRLNISLSVAQDMDYIITIVDAAGRIVMRQQLQAISGTNSFEMNVSELSSGLYSVLLESEGVQDIQRLIVE